MALLIPFDSTISQLNLEKILLFGYSKSLDSDEIIFDLRKVYIGGLYQLGMIVLWAIELKRHGKNVKFDLNMRDTAELNRYYALLHRWRVVEVLEAAKISIIHPERYQARKNSKIESSHKTIIGLHLFKNKRDLSELMQKLNDQQEELFGEFAKIEWIGNGALRYFIFKELIDNVFDHGKGMSGFTAMSVIGKQYKSYSKNDIKSIGYWEKEYFDKAPAEKFLEIIVGDHGPGFSKTLGGIFKTQAQKKPNQNEVEIIKFAFNKYVSSKRNPNKYINELLVRTSTNKRKNVTGLYFVKNLVERNGGMLSVRSGASWFYMSFLHQSFHSGSNCDTDMFKLAEFGGCQYKIIFPLTCQEPIVGNSVSQDDDERRVIPYISEFLSASITSSYPMGELSKRMLHTIHEEVFSEYSKLNPNCGYIFDVSNLVQSKRQALAIIHMLLDMQVTEKPIIVLALNDSEELIKASADEIELNREAGDMPIMLVGPRFTLSVLCANDAETHIFNFLVKEDRVTNPEVVYDAPSMVDIANGIRNLLHYEATEKKWYLKTKIKELYHTLYLHAVEICNKWNASPPIGIKLEGRYLLPSPSNVYCEYFWNIREIFRDRSKIDYVICALTLLIYQKQTTQLIALSQSAFQLVEYMLDWLPSANKSKPTVITVTSPDNLAQLMLLQTEAKRAGCVIVTDVVGTGTSLNQILKSTSDMEIIDILTVVDATDVNANIFGNVTITSLIKSRQRYINQLPAEWSYSSVQSIDKTLHEPVARVKTNQARYIADEEIIDTLSECASFDCLYCGHFSSGNKHFSTFVLTARLVTKNSDYIVGKVAAFLETLQSSLKKEEKINITHILYNSLSSAAKHLSHNLADSMKSTIAVPIRADLLRTHLSEPIRNEISMNNAKDILIIEPACSSADTARSLITYAASKTKKAKIFIFILADRMDLVESAFLTDINMIGGNRLEVIRYAKIGPSPYNIEQCPQCNMLAEYTILAETLGNSSFENILKNRKEMFQIRGISVFHDPEEGAITNRKLLYIAESLFQVKMHSAVSDLELRHKTASLLPDRHDPETLFCCGVLLAFAREAPLFRKDTGTLSEVIYPSLCNKIVNLCLVHLFDNGAIDAEVVDSAYICLVELTIFGNCDIKWWIDFSHNLTGENIKGILVEIARLYNTDSLNYIQVEISRRIVEGLWEYSNKKLNIITSTEINDAFSDVNMILNKSDISVSAQQKGAPSNAWETCNRLLKHHRQVATSLQTLNKMITATRSHQELREYYENWWQERVCFPITETLLPSLCELVTEPLKGVANGKSPLDVKLVNMIEQKLIYADSNYKYLISAVSQNKPSAEYYIDKFNIYSGELISLLIPTESPTQIGLKQLVVQSVDEIEPLVRLACQKLTVNGVKSSIEITRLDSDLGIFVQKSNLITCLEIMLLNIIQHAFPRTHKTAKTVLLRLYPVMAYNSYVLEVEDSGVGFIEQLKFDFKRESGLKCLTTFAEAYGGKFSVGKGQTGCNARLEFNVVRL